MSQNKISRTAIFLIRSDQRNQKHKKELEDSSVTVSNLLIHDRFTFHREYDNLNEIGCNFKMKIISSKYDGRSFKHSENISFKMIHTINSLKKKKKNEIILNENFCDIL